MIKTIRLADIKPNDVVDGEGICVSVWLQGCPHRCPGCHNPSTWDFWEGTLFDTEEVIEYILSLISANGVKRNLSILGGEPLCLQNYNILFTQLLAKKAKEKYPDITIFCWTGNTLEELKEKFNLSTLLQNIDVLIDGPYIQDLRNLKLYLRGSSNQKIRKKGIDY